MGADAGQHDAGHYIANTTSEHPRRWERMARLEPKVVPFAVQGFTIDGWNCLF